MVPSPSPCSTNFVDESQRFKDCGEALRCCRRLKISPLDGLTGIDLVRLTDRMGFSLVVIEVQRIIGQEDFSWGRKLPFNQNLELMCALVPDLVSRSAGLRSPGHQNQLLGEDEAKISISLTP